MTLHPQTAALVDSLGGSGTIVDLSPEEARLGYRTLGQLLGPGPEVATVIDRSVPGPAGDIPVRVYSPHGPGPHPVLVFFHGGGQVIGDLDSHDRECRLLCDEAGCLVLAVDYRLGPEHPSPAGADDAMAALDWVHAHGAEVDADTGRLAVGGDSAGGTLAAVCALHARDVGIALRLQLLVYPGVDARGGYDSLDRNAHSPFLDRATIEWFRAHHHTEAGSSGADDWRASPILAESHADLAPAYLAACTLDPLFDENLAYAETLRTAGVAVQKRIFEGQPHLLFQLSPVLDDGKVLLAECAAALRDAFGR